MPTSEAPTASDRRAPTPQWRQPLSRGYTSAGFYLFDWRTLARSVPVRIGHSRFSSLSAASLSAASFACIGKRIAARLTSTHDLIHSSAKTDRTWRRFSPLISSARKRRHAIGRTSMIGSARFDFIHFMHYTALPENQKEFPSLWVDFPNKYFDPARGHELYQRYLSQLVLADKLGFDAVVVNEHHNTAYSMMPAPNLIAATLIPQVKNAKICVWGTPPNLEHPNRLAEEYAMLDVLSQGRLEVAFPLGTGMEYWSNSVNPADCARASPGIDRDHFAGLDAGRADLVLRRLLHLSLSQSLAAAGSEAASALLHRRHRQSGDHRSRLEARLRLRVGVRHQTTGARAQSGTAPRRSRARPPHPAGPASAASHHLRRGDRSKKPEKKPSSTSSISSRMRCARRRPSSLRPAIFRSIS